MGAQSTPGEGHVSADDLFREHAPFVARFLFRLGVRPDGIDDAVQEVFLVVHRQGGYRPGPAKPTSYLANLAMHAASAHRRRERARQRREVDGLVEDVASTRSDPVQVLEVNESLRRLQGALDRLDPDLRTTLVLVELEGETCASVAAAMRVPVGTVYWRLHQARKKFQRALQATESALPGRPALAVHPASLASGVAAQRKERAGMMVLLMTPRSWSGSEARDLLRLGAGRPPLSYAVREGLLRHQQIAASSAPLPSWAHGIGATAKGVSWIAASTATVAILGATAVLVRAGHARTWSERHVTMVATPPTSRSASSSSAWRPVETLASAASDPGVPVDALPAAAAVPRGAAAARHADPPEAASLGNPIDPRAAAPWAPASSSASPSDDDLLELQEVARAERLLSTDPGRALSLVIATEARFPNGYVREERRYVEIMALIGLGRLDEAGPKVTRFLRDYPESAFGRRVREASRRVHLVP